MAITPIHNKKIIIIMKSKLFNDLCDALVTPVADTPAGLNQTLLIDEKFMSIIGVIDHAPSAFLTFAEFIAKYKTETFGFTYSADSTRSRVAMLIGKDYHPAGAQLSLIRLTLNLRDYFEAAIAGEDLSALQGTQLMQDFISVCEVIAAKNGFNLTSIAQSVIEQRYAVNQSLPSESHD
jgi:hypothetical protein